MAYSTLQNLVFLIASGSRNLGRTCAFNIVKRGGRVVLCDKEDRKDTGEEIQDELGEDHCLFVPADLSQEKDVRNVINRTQEKFGKLDVTINCPDEARAGKMVQKNLDSIIDKQYMEAIFKPNVTATFNVCRLSAELMAKNTPDSQGQRGLIINKSHTLGFGSSLAPYTMSQAAIMGMTLPMARDLQDVGVRVNSIAIGLYPYQVPNKSGKTLKLICSLMAFPHKLGSEDTFYHLCEKIVLNNYVNGEVIRLDGGLNTNYL